MVAFGSFLDDVLDALNVSRDQHFHTYALQRARVLAGEKMIARGEGNVPAHVEQ